MICVISPAKKMASQFTTPLSTTSPVLKADAEVLLKEAQTKSVADLQSLMGISEKLALLNHDRFQTMDLTAKDQNPAVALFAGDTYVGLDAASMDDADLTYAQDHLRILSGLFGLLRPLDKIQPYRLEMGTRFENPRGGNLYQFWGGKIAAQLNASDQSENPVVVNLASQEYFKAIDRKTLRAQIITPNFKEWRNGKLKIISFSAKRARGMMARFIIRNRIKNPDEIKAFNVSGYSYSPEHSEGDNWVFTREPL